MLCAAHLGRHGIGRSHLQNELLRAHEEATVDMRIARFQRMFAGTPELVCAVTDAEQRAFEKGRGEAFARIVSAATPFVTAQAAIFSRERPAQCGGATRLQVTTLPIGRIHERGT